MLVAEPKSVEQKKLMQEATVIIEKILELDDVDVKKYKELDFTNSEVINQYLGDIPEQIKDLIYRSFYAEGNPAGLRKSRILNNFIQMISIKISTGNPFFFYIMNTKNYEYILENSPICQ